MLSSKETGELLRLTKTKVDEMGSWQPVRAQLADGNFKTFCGVKLREARTAGGRHSELIAVQCDRNSEEFYCEFKESVDQVEVGAGYLPEDTRDERDYAMYYGSVHIRFLEMLYPF